MEKKSPSQSLNQTLGRANQARGRANESRVIEAFGALEERLPDWFHAILPASRSEDERGIDIVVNTDVGDIFVQVKSSFRSAKSFHQNRRKNPHIKVVVVTERLTSKKIREAVLSVVSKERNWVLSKRWRDRINWMFWLDAA